MKKFFTVIMILSLFPLFAYAANTLPGQLTYVPLEPLPCVDQNGNTATPGSCQTGDNNTFPAYLSGMFKILLSLGGLFAVVMLVVAGISYMLSESSGGISKAKDRAKSALWGLLLLASCWLILYIINPSLLRFDIFTKDLGTESQAALQAQNNQSNTTPSSAQINEAQQKCAAKAINWTGTAYICN